jgi:hypothetical protein
MDAETNNFGELRGHPLAMEVWNSSSLQVPENSDRDTKKYNP